MVVALSKEEDGKVGEYLEKMDIGLITGAGATAGSAYGVSSIPHSVLIGPDGRIAWRGDPRSLSDGTVKAALKGARKPPKGGYMAFMPSVEETRALAGALKAIDAGSLGKALAAARKVAANEASTPAEREAAETLAAEILAHAQSLLDASDRMVERLDLVLAVDVYTVVAKELKGTTIGEQAQKQLTHIEDSETLQRELKAAQAFQKTKKSTAKLSTAKKRKKYKAFADKWSGTKAAERARTLARSR